MKVFLNPSKQKNTDSKFNELKVLLVGNNPLEMNSIYAGLTAIKSKISQIDVSFSEEDAVKRILQSKHDCIVIDDNIGLSKLKNLVNRLNELKIANYSITVLKSINKEALTSGVNDYLLKNGLTAERLLKSFSNNLKAMRSQIRSRSMISKS